MDLNIIKLRKGLAYSQMKFAELLGVSISTLRRWEKGENSPSPLGLEKLYELKKAIEDDKLESYMAKNSLRRKEAENNAQPFPFEYNGNKFSALMMPYVYNGPDDQKDFYKTLLKLQQKNTKSFEWSQYSRRLSLVQEIDGKKTAQYLMEKPRPTNKSWSANVGPHGWHRYVGRFPAQLIRAIINYFGADEKDIILDPFCGSGTTLVESRLLGIPAIGVEISPLSAMISRVKSKFSLNADCITEVIKELEAFYIMKWEKFLAGKSIDDYSYDELITRDGNSINAFSNYERWFTKEAFLGTSIVVEFILQKSGYIQEFIATALSGKMRSIGNVDVDVVRAEYRKTPRENVNVLKLVTSQLKKMNTSLININVSHTGLLKDETTINVIEDSCNEVDIDENSISHIITSPPYGVESLSYLRTHLLSFRALEPLLGIDPYSFNDGVIGSEFLGDEEIVLDKLEVTKKSATFAEFFRKLPSAEDSKKHKKRINMMMKFFEDLDTLIVRFNYWLKIEGKVAFVIGNKKIGNSIIPTDKIIGELFTANGFYSIGCIAHKLKTNNSNSKVPWQERIIENEFIMMFEKR